MLKMTDRNDRPNCKIVKNIKRTKRLQRYCNSIHDLTQFAIYK